MSKNSLENKKAVITTMFVVFLLISAGSIIPTINAKSLNKIFKKHEEVKEIETEILYNKNITYEQIISYLKEKCNKENWYFLLELVNTLDQIFQKDFREFSEEFEKNFPIFFEAANKYCDFSSIRDYSINNNYLKAISLSNNVVDFAKAISKKIACGSKENCLNSLPQDLLSIIETIDNQIQSKENSAVNEEQTTEKDDNFTRYYELYTKAKDYWRKWNGAGSIDEWYIEMTKVFLGAQYYDNGDYDQNWKRSPFIVSNIALGFFTILSWIIGVTSRDPAAMLISLISSVTWLSFNIILLLLLYQGYRYFTGLTERKITFSVRIVEYNDTTKGIEGLESYYPSWSKKTDIKELRGYIFVKNTNASRLEYAKDFEYYLGPSLVKNKTGWYCIENWNPSEYPRMGDKPGEDGIGYNWRYFKAPPAPGVYEIKIYNSSDEDSDIIIIDGVAYDCPDPITTEEIGLFGSYVNPCIKLKVHTEN